MIDTTKYSLILPGRIVSFDATNQTAEVQISIDRVFSSSLSISYNKTREPIKGVLVQTCYGGGWSLTHPIKAGDTCKLSFSQAGYDHWLYEDKDTAGTLDNVPKPWLKRKFSQDDGFCEVGFNTLPRAIQSFSAVNSEWRNADATQIIRLKDDLDIEIESTTAIKIIAPTVTVECSNSIVNASVKAQVTTPLAEVTASTKCTVTTPLLDLICATSVNITSPLVAQSGNLTVGGTIAATGGLTAASIQTAGTVVATGEITGNGKLLSTHEHAGDGGTGSGASTGPPT